MDVMFFFDAEFRSALSEFAARKRLYGAAQLQHGQPAERFRIRACHLIQGKGAFRKTVVQCAERGILYFRPHSGHGRRRRRLLP